MKFFYLLFAVLVALNCSSSKNISTLEKLTGAQSFLSVNCPKDGVCTIQILPDKALTLKTDAFGQYYGEQVESNQILITYSYKRNVPQNTADGHFVETYYFSIPKNTEAITLTDAELQSVNLVVERQCFCKGSAGFFKITNGNLALRIQKNELTLKADFSHEKLPLVITKIDEKINLEQ